MYPFLSILDSIYLFPLQICLCVFFWVASLHRDILVCPEQGKCSQPVVERRIALGPKTLLSQHFSMPPYSQPQRQARCCGVSCSQISQRLSQLSFLSPLPYAEFGSLLCSPVNLFGHSLYFLVTDLVTHHLPLASDVIYCVVFFLSQQPLLHLVSGHRELKQCPLWFVEGRWAPLWKTSVSGEHLVLLWEAHPNLWI